MSSLQHSTRVSRSRLALVAASLLTAAALLHATPSAAVVQVGQLAPDFTKTDLNGATQTLSAYRGKVVVLFLLGYN